MFMNKVKHFFSIETILTPHPGEMSRLTGKSIVEINNNRVNILQDTCSKLNVYIVLKGAHSLIGLPDKNLFINLSGNPGMATAGSGDVLTGIITSLAGQGLSDFDAAILGVYIHGLAGDIVAENLGQVSVIATDIIDSVAEAFKRIDSSV